MALRFQTKTKRLTVNTVLALLVFILVGSIFFRVLKVGAVDAIDRVSLGGDYCIDYNGGDVQHWVTWGPTDHSYPSWAAMGSAFTPWYNTVEMSIAFPGHSGSSSILDYTKFDDMLDIWDSYGMKVIVYLNQPYTSNYLFDSSYVSAWTNFAGNFSGDSRIEAFSIYSELFQADISGKTDYECTAQFKTVAQAIHAADPTRTVIFPTGMFYYANAATWISDIQTLNIDDLSYVAFDVVHGYYFNDPTYDGVGVSPSDKAENYADDWIAPSVAAFGSSKCYCGETFAAIGNEYMFEDAVDADQIEFLSNFINWFQYYNIGFNILSFFDNTEKANLNLDAMEAADYPTKGLPTPTYPPTPPPTPTPTPTITPTPSYVPYPTPSVTLPPGVAGITSSSAVVLDFNAGESMVIQSTSPSYTVTFYVVSGAWAGEATVTVTENNGMLAFQPTSSGSLRVTPSNVAIKVTVNSQSYSGAFSFLSGNTYYVRWSMGSISPVTVIANRILYLRSQTQTTNDQVGYLLSPNSGTTNASAYWWTSGSVNSAFGYVLYTVEEDGTVRALTSSSPTTVTTLTSNAVGYYNSTVAIPERDLSIGKDAIKMILYINLNSTGWQPVASYISPQLMEKQISEGYWQLTLYCKRYYDGSNTYATVYWGDADTSNSYISGIEFLDVLPQEIALSYGLQGNFFGMILYPYTIIGGDMMFYGLGLLFVSGLYYLRYKKFEPILIMIVLFGGVVGFLVPDPAWRMFYFVLLFVIAIILFRVFH